MMENANAQSDETEGPSTATNDAPSAELLARIEDVRTRIHGAFGQSAMAMMMLPRYRHLPLADLSSVLMEPLLRDRVAIASTKPDPEKPADATVGIAIWASVSEEVDAKIREQIKAGVFPVRLSADEWNSGEINWLFDVIAPSRKLASSVIANLKQVVKQGSVNIHPLVTRIVGTDELTKMGATTTAENQ